jgi:UDP-2-acetamido-2,6-beta-L-arabino-hexul-4-ose reductase
VIKTNQSGQVSFFTANPNATRGSHFHHTKIEKFVVVAGRARFRFRSLYDGTVHEKVTSASSAEVVESIPGWVHDVTNVGEGELTVLVWANETFDPLRPDTFHEQV